MPTPADPDITPADAAFAPTQAAAALALGIGRSTLNRWLADGAPGRTEAGFDVEALRRWRDRSMLPARRGAGDPGDVPQDTAGDGTSGTPGTRDGAALTDRERLVRAMADQRQALAELSRLRVEIESGRWMRIEDVREHDVARCVFFRRALQALPRRLSGELQGRSIRETEAIITAALRDVCNRLAAMK